jgi:hypothetical protein
MPQPLIVEEPDRFILRRRPSRANTFLFGGALVYGALGLLLALSGMLAPGLLCGAFGCGLFGWAVWQRGRRDEVAVLKGRLEIRRWVGPVPIGHQLVDVPTLTLVDHEARPDAMFAVVAMTGPGYLEVLRDQEPAVRIAQGLRYTAEELQDLKRRLLVALLEPRK